MADELHLLTTTHCGNDAVAQTHKPPLIQHNNWEQWLLAISQATRKLFMLRDFDQGLEQALAVLGVYTAVNRISVAEIHGGKPAGELLLSQRYTWFVAQQVMYKDTPALQNLSLRRLGLDGWYEKLVVGQAVRGPVDQLPGHEQSILRHHEVNMFVAVPIFVDNQLWGLIAYDDDGVSLAWNDNAESVLQALAAGIGGAMECHRDDAKMRQLCQAVQQSADSVVITDCKGNIEYANTKFLETTGYTLAEVIGQNPRILKSGEQPDEVYEHLWRTLVNGDEWTGEFHNKRKNGELFWEMVKISPVRDGRGETTHYLATKEDITVRKQVQEALREQREFTENLVQNLSVPTFVINCNHHVLMWNKACEDLTGSTAEQASLARNAGQALYGLPYSCLADVVIDGYMTLDRSQYSVCRSSEFGRNGLHAERWVEIGAKKRYLISTACPIYNSEDEIIAAVETFHDVTERKIAEERLERDLLLARRMQQTFLPSPGRCEQVDIRFLYEPHHHVSGDLFDYQWNRDHTVLYGSLFDVMGHGLATALLTSSLRVLFRQMAETDASMVERLSAINCEVMPYFQDDSLAAAICFEFDFTRRTLTYAAAGINYFLASCAGLPELTRVPGPFLGLVCDSVFESHCVQFEPGDCFYFLSDGFFDVLPPQETWQSQDIDKMMEMLAQLVAEHHCQDDASAVCFRIGA